MEARKGPDSDMAIDPHCCMQSLDCNKNRPGISLSGVPPLRHLAQVTRYQNLSVPIDLMESLVSKMSRYFYQSRTMNQPIQSLVPHLLHFNRQ